MSQSSTPLFHTNIHMFSSVWAHFAPVLSRVVVAFAFTSCAFLLGALLSMRYALVLIASAQ